MALSVFLMLVTWKETEHWCAQPASARNPPKLVLIRMRAVQGRSQDPLQENLKFFSEAQLRRNKQGVVHGRYVDMNQAKKVELRFTWLKGGKSQVEVDHLADVQYQREKKQQLNVLRTRQGDKELYTQLTTVVPVGDQIFSQELGEYSSMSPS